VLTELRIKNFAIIESLTLPLASGFNVLTGETGAGKSIIVGALSLLLGERASTDLIRTGADKATVEGVFDAAGYPELLRLLDDRGVDVDDHTVVLRREIAGTGRTRGWVNSATTTAGVLAEVGRLLVNLHGQHEAQSLLDPESQRRILDEFGGAADQAARVERAHDALASVTREIAQLVKRRAEVERRADYLRHVLGEIDAARVRVGEDTQLDEEARRLEHAEELRSLAEGMAEALGGEEGGVLHALGGVHRSLAAIQRIDPTLARLQELYDGAFYSLEELARELGQPAYAWPARLWRATASFKQPSLSVRRPYSCPSATVCLPASTNSGPYFRTTMTLTTMTPTTSTTRIPPTMRSTFNHVGIRKPPSTRARAPRVL
jgi:DNA repair protein RecN (Recombination protein N)